jgi:hypothetical protein
MLVENALDGVEYNLFQINNKAFYLVVVQDGNLMYAVTGTMSSGVISFALAGFQLRKELLQDPWKQLPWKGGQ